MKLGMRGIKCIALCTLAVLCIHIMQKYENPALHKKIVVHVDPLLSAQTQKNIDQFTKEKNSQKIPTYKDFVQILVQQFPYIKSIEIEKNASGLLSYTYESAAPIIAINQDMVLTDGGILVLKNNFAEHTIASLHTITVPSGFISPALLNGIASFTDDFLNTYDICWKSDQEIILKDKLHAGFTVLCDADSILDVSVLQKCTTIKHELIDKGSLASPALAHNDAVTKKKAPKSWIADIRFKNQIIVSSELGSPFSQNGVKLGSPFSQNGAKHGGQSYG